MHANTHSTHTRTQKHTHTHNTRTYTTHTRTRHTHVHKNPSCHSMRKHLAVTTPVVATPIPVCWNFCSTVVVVHAGMGMGLTVNTAGNEWHHKKMPAHTGMDIRSDYNLVSYTTFNNSLPLNSQGTEDNPNLNDNYRFYANEIPCRPDGAHIDDIHNSWWGRYDKLEHHHKYIQW